MAIISILPPKLSPDSLALSISFIMRSAATGSAHLTADILDPSIFSLWYGDSSNAAQSTSSDELEWIPPIDNTWPWTLIPNSSKNRFATAPAATLAANSLALERSKILRASDCIYLVTPGVSAWPGLI